jgi:hypothetical protein
MAQFPDTQWSLVLRSGEETPLRIAAFSDLACAYRPAILAFFRAHVPGADAEDATQSFLAASFEHRWWARADAAAGSFRAFLLMLMRRHLGRVRQRPGVLAGVAELERVPDPAAGAEAAFDARFAMLLAQRALDRLRHDYAARGRGALFDPLVLLLRDPPAHGGLQQAAVGLGMAPNTLAVELRRLRSRLREGMREELRGLCADEVALAADWSSLEAVLSAG